MCACQCVRFDRNSVCVHLLTRMCMLYVCVYTSMFLWMCVCSVCMCVCMCVCMTRAAAWFRLPQDPRSFKVVLNIWLYRWKLRDSVFRTQWTNQSHVQHHTLESQRHLKVTSILSQIWKMSAIYKQSPVQGVLSKPYMYTIWSVGLVTRLFMSSDKRKLIKLQHCYGRVLLR